MKTTTIATGDTWGPWQNRPSPLGPNFNVTERRGTRVTIFEADFYGTGAHTYVVGEPLLETKGTPGVRRLPGGWQTGDPKDVARYAAKIGAEVTA